MYHYSRERLAELLSADALLLWQAAEQLKGDALHDKEKTAILLASVSRRLYELSRAVPPSDPGLPQHEDDATPAQPLLSDLVYGGNPS